MKYFFQSSSMFGIGVANIADLTVAENFKSCSIKILSSLTERVQRDTHKHTHTEECKPMHIYL